MSERNGLHSIESAVDALSKGRLIILLDDQDRENEGDLIGAAALATPEMINFMVTHARGAFIAAFMPHGLSDKLGIPGMDIANDSFNNTQFRVSVDARTCSSGSSAGDRAEVVRLLGNASSQPGDFVKPGHVVPIEAHPQGLSARRGHTESGVALMELAGFNPPVAVDLEILDSKGDMAQQPELHELAREFDLPIITVNDLAHYLELNKA